MPREHPGGCNDQPYQDYVIKDGKLVGRFDELYRRVDDPWYCQTLVRSAANDLLCELLRRHARSPRTVLDIGCGLGALSARIRDAVGPVEMVAVDISAAAIDKARAAYPGIDFHVHDMTTERWSELPAGLDLITMAELLWYVLPQLESVLAGALAALRRGGRLFVLQHFYDPAEQRYGNDVMTAPADLVALLSGAGFVVDGVETVPDQAPFKAIAWCRKP